MSGFTNIKKPQSLCYWCFTVFYRREEGIRTLDTVTHILAFQASSFNHSDTSLIRFANNLKKTDFEKQNLTLNHFATQWCFKKIFKILVSNILT